jgi:DNA topoisomerase VI subunit B
VIERVITNVVSTARRHGKPPIVVTAEQRDRHVRIVVEDHGPGIAEELLPRLFAASSTETRAGPASGSRSRVHMPTRTEATSCTTRAPAARASPLLPR